MIREIKSAIDNGSCQNNLDSIKIWLNENVQISYNTNPITYLQLAIKYGREFVGTLDETLKQIPGLDWARISMSTNGIDFTSQEFINEIQDLVTKGAITQNIANSLLSLGIETGPRYKCFGYSEIPTDEIINQCLNTLNNVDWPERNILISYNNSGNTIFAFRFTKANTINGIRIEGDTIDAFVNPSDGNKLILLNKIESAINEYIGGLNGS